MTYNLSMTYNLDTLNIVQSIAENTDVRFLPDLHLCSTYPFHDALIVHLLQMLKIS